ncbi:uncharacterized protein J4E84_001704 [Alternaria hordeiaustralica]|uniref:uncharacterized protein n=1 Tax=Alternaria hordeiaustralica TaxID=1187925 RepID=UPI0020C373CE|nr:uncharacterized protein J4E84_001704 [Alternaria hordeiaustralica]KAI4695080.1 hypothetical protein J4E84_001704 [Alternaria hordeiaustralica]
MNDRDDAISISSSSARASAATGSSTLATTGSLSAPENVECVETGAQNMDRYIALGCLHFKHAFDCSSISPSSGGWVELLQQELPDEIKASIGIEASRLLEAQWIRIFARRGTPGNASHHGLLRVYLLPEDWARRTIDRNSKSLKNVLRTLLQQIDISPSAWNGDSNPDETRYFDPWAHVEPFSLYYLFNKLPSPAPDVGKIKCRYTRAAVQDVLDSAAVSEWSEHGEQALPGLKTRLYAYQTRSASLMLQREASPQLQLDPRLEARTSPDGKEFYYGPRDGSFLQEPRYYEMNRGGILAETMGLGKTVICLAVILASKGHLPKIPVAYRPLPPLRKRPGSLADMAISSAGRHSTPMKSFLEQSEANGAGDITSIKDALDRDVPFYEIPPDIPRMNRNTRIPPTRQLVLSSATIIVVPRNLLHQWQSETQKHILPGGLKILVVDSVPKRASKTKITHPTDETMDFQSELPAPTELMKFDVVLFTRNRFEQEIQDGQDEQGRRMGSGASRVCNCPYIGATRIPDCSCVDTDRVYESPLKKIHWLRIIIDEGHSFSSSVSNAVLVAKQIQAERRWVVSGTPAKSLVGVEVDMSTVDPETDPVLQRELAIEKRKTFSNDKENSKAAKALGMLASHFLMVRPWCENSEGKLDWDEYVYRHEHQYQKTYSGFSSCFVRALEGLVVKTRPEDVEKNIILPPMRHRTVYLKPCWFDKMTANLFIQVLRANAITSERTDVDYLFHKNSVKARHSLIRNLRQSNFTWTGFSLSDVVATLETSSKYLSKEDRNCSLEDAQSLLESSQIVSKLTASAEWIALSTSHEVGMAVNSWPEAAREAFALVYPAEPIVVGVTQLIEGQLHVDSSIRSSDPTVGLDAVGYAAKAKAIAMAEEEGKLKESGEGTVNGLPLQRTGVPTSLVKGQQPPTSRRISAIASKSSPKKSTGSNDVNGVEDTPDIASPVRTKKRKLTFADETADLPADSDLQNTRCIGTTSAKLTYLLDKVMQHQEKEKIIIFYDGDNAAFYIAQCLELMYVNHRIYARTLNNQLRSEYVRLFNEDPDVRVLLIDVACGALGLNLNAASVVLIVNPINRPNIEAQAIKRAHRIGQTKEVVVETLVLENTIEHAIFNRAKKMSRADHQEAKELEDDAGIIEIIQNAQILPVGDDEGEGLSSFALLQTPQQVFGRPNRHKYHRYGGADKKTKDGPQKKVKTTKSTKKNENEDASGTNSTTAPSTPGTGLPVRGPAQNGGLRVAGAASSQPVASIFGSG